MGKLSKYVSPLPDSSGVVRYSDDENAIWAELYARQEKAVQGKCCNEFLQGLDLINMPKHRVPQLPEISKVLKRETGWEVAYVPALIPFSEFFKLLANKQFPAATFVRTREELDYLQEPDIFHELFGHTPLLTNPHFAEFTHLYGKLGLAASKEDRVFLARLYWFTVEFGLVAQSSGSALNGTPMGHQRPASLFASSGTDIESVPMQAKGGRAGLSHEGSRLATDGPAEPDNALRIYGGGILSSIGETDYAYSSNVALRKRFDLLDVLRTPYRIDIMQPLYYVLEDFMQLSELTKRDLMADVAEARKLGLHAPLYPPKSAASEAVK